MYMSIYDSKINRSELMGVLSDIEKVASLPFDDDLKLLHYEQVFKNDDVNECFMQEVFSEYGHLADDKKKIKILCFELAEAIHNYVKVLSNNDVDKIYDKWNAVQEESDRLQEEERKAELARQEEERKAELARQEEEQRAYLARKEEERKEAERQRKLNEAIYKCRNTLDGKILAAESSMKEFKYDAEWRKNLRQFIAEILCDTPRITGRQIAELANTQGGFDKLVSPYMIYKEWNAIKEDIKTGTFGTHYPDNIVQKDTFLESVKVNNVIKDTDLNGLLKKDLSIYDIIDMLNEYDKRPSENGMRVAFGNYSRTACVIPDEELAYENFFEKESIPTMEAVDASNDKIEIPDDLSWMDNVEVDESKLRDVSLDSSQDEHDDVELVDEDDDWLNEVLEPDDIDEVSEIFK